MPEPGHRADLAVEKALSLLKHGGLGQGRLLLIGSSLSKQERQGIRLQLQGSQAPSLSILGIGSREGTPVTQESGEFLKDAQGAILVPRLDSPTLKAFASEMGGRYRQARLDDKDLRHLGLLDGPQSLRNDGQLLHLDTWADQGYWLLLPLLLLAACAGRRGWLFFLPLLLLGAPQPSYAFDFQDLWLRPDQQGQLLLKKNARPRLPNILKTRNGKASRCMKRATTPKRPSVLPKAATPIPTTIEATPWPKAASWKRRSTPTSKPWKRSPTCSRR